MKRTYRVWVLTDAQGNEIIRGRKHDVCNKAYFRYVYQHIYSDNLYRTEEVM